MTSDIPYLEIESLPGRLFVIGDLHGCSSELRALLAYLEKNEELNEEDHLVFIGDYIDRGPDSRGVIECLLELSTRHEKTIFLKGNHEEMLLSFLGFEGREGAVYLLNGGSECLRSYGFKTAKAEEVLATFPRNHLSFLLNLQRFVIGPDFVLVHAGLDPLRDLRLQLDRDIFWIREEFIHNIHHFDKVIYFGHTPYKDVLVNFPYKVGIDTGLVYKNMLSCIEITTKKVLQVQAGTNKVKASDLSAKASKQQRFMK